MSKTVTTKYSTTSHTKTIDDRVIDTSVVPYMRSKVITFVADGLRPYTRVYPFFDGKNVTPYTINSGGGLGGALLTDANGKVNGTFFLPNNSYMRFKTGTRLFKLMDHPGGKEEESTTIAEAPYTATGTLNTRQKTILTTKTITKTVTTEKKIVWRDPLAQSFLIGSEGGNFITAIDIWFESKDLYVPVSIELREMENGYPTQTIVPGGVRTLLPSEVNISTNGVSSPTKFVFDRPIYLQDGVEYCFVLMANSTKYNVWISRMGETVFGSTQTVAKQPFVGVMFKSQNNSTWTAAQTDDIKFNIYRAKFDTTKTAVVKLTNNEVVPVQLNLNAIQVNNNSALATIKTYNHGLFVGSKVKIEGAVGALGITDAMLNKTHTVTTVVDSDTFKVTLSGNATGTGDIGGDDVYVYKNYMFDIFVPNVNELRLPDTSIEYSLQTTTGKSPSGTEVPFNTNVETTAVENRENFVLKKPMVVLAKADETANYSSNKSLVLTATMKSNRDNISPVIDLDGITSTLVNNRINNPTTLSETNSIGGNSMMRYYTNPAQLRLAANSLKVFLDVNKQPETQIKMFYKTGQTEADVWDASWIAMEPLVEALETDGNSFTEQEYEVNDIGEFTYYMVKIVMLSSNSAVVPKAKNLRVLALGT